MEKSQYETATNSLPFQNITNGELLAEKMTALNVAVENVEPIQVEEAPSPQLEESTITTTNAGEFEGGDAKQEEVKELFTFRTIRLNLPKDSSRPHTLLGPHFPLELRQKIYTYLFTPSPHTTTRWSLRHLSTCPLRSRTNVSEAPPFATEPPIHMDEVQRWKLTHPVPRPGLCRCAKRHSGLNLLLVNRQIYHEAAPYFYSLTEFCFDDGFELLGFCKVIPEIWKDLIKSVSIVGPTYDASAAHTSWYRNPPRERTIEVVWDAILTLTSLKVLKLTQFHVQHSTRRLRALREKQEVEILVVEIRKVWSFHRDERLENIWVEYEERFDERPSKQLHTAWGPPAFYWIFNRGLDGVREELERMAENEGEIATKLSPMKILVVTNPQATPETKSFTLWGLPNTKEQRISLLREESKDRTERKRLGLPSRKEEETRIKIEKARMAKKVEREEKLAEEEAESKRLRVFKKKEQTFYQKEEMREREKILENKRKEVLGKAKSAEIYRKRERKAAFKRDMVVVRPKK